MLRKEIAVAVFALLASLAAAQAFGLSKEGLMFGKLGAISNKKTGGGGGGSSCASTGIFDLSNVCNDIYFIGALK